MPIHVAKFNEGLLFKRYVYGKDKVKGSFGVPEYV